MLSNPVLAKLAFPQYVYCVSDVVEANALSAILVTELGIVIDDSAVAL